MAGRSSNNPEDVNYVPTIFKDRKGELICPVFSDRVEWTVKRVWVKEELDLAEEAAEPLVAVSSSPGDI